MEKPEDNKQEISEEPKKLIEGLIGKYCDNWYEKLPSGIKKEQAEIYSGSDGQCYWHLKPEFMESEEEREKYKKEREAWEG